MAFEGSLGRAEGGPIVIEDPRRFDLFCGGCQRMTDSSRAGLLGTAVYRASSAGGREGRRRTSATA